MAPETPVFTKLLRLEVSGGFLDGLKLPFSDGLNVLIGARGAGKTSVLELVRFALGVEGMTAEAEAAASRQAREVLSDGTVSVLCEINGETLVFSRSGLDEPPPQPLMGPAAPLIVSQSEIEAIGLDPTSRRMILDHLVPATARADLDLSQTQIDIGTLERRLERLREERERFIERFDAHAHIPRLLAEAEEEQRDAAARVEATRPLQRAIEQHADSLGRARSASDAYRIASDALRAWRKQIARAELERPIPALPSATIETEVVSAIDRVKHLLEQAGTEIERVERQLGEVRAEARREQVSIQATLKESADTLDQIQRGAGEIGRRVSSLRQQLQEREGLSQRISELDREIANVTAQRDAELDDLERQSNARYDLRSRSATGVGDEFHGRIEVRVDKSGEYRAYEAALVQLLQGSNLQYKSLAAAICANMSPRELVTAVESVDPAQIVQAAGVSEDRAARLVAYLQERSRVDLLLAPLDDAVDFALLDGQEYKATGNLSMGQRCTVVLPLLLAERRDVILLDQPEDHLDNAFIVDTLVEAIRDRAASGQVIVATHNANIPVLGEASQIVVLASDGRRGFVTSNAPLDDSSAVSAITTLMEGGRAAFARRAAFYSDHDE